MIYNKYQGERKINTLTIQLSMRVNGDTVYYRKDIKRKKGILFLIKNKLLGVDKTFVVSILESVHY